LLVNAFNHSGPFSFQYPDFFTHQKGKCGFDPACQLIKIIPHSSFNATCLHCSISSQKTTAESQKSLSLAIFIDSSMDDDFIILTTGQKVSSS
jgi:hypothetical protein